MSHTQAIVKACRQSGLQVNAAATARINAYLSTVTASDVSSSSEDDPQAREAAVKAALLELLTKVKEDPLPGSTLTLEQVETALNGLMVAAAGEGAAARMRVIDVISAFEQPRHHYDTVRRIFFEVQSDRTKFGVAEERADMLRSRYSMLLQRLQRRPEFQPQKVGGGAASSNQDGMDDDGEHVPLCTIESLLGQTGKKCIFGQLCQLTDGQYSLEDIHSSIPIDFSSPALVATSGLFTEGCFVLAEGETRDDGVFQAVNLIMPPPERKVATLKVFPSLDYLGAADVPTAAASGNAEAKLKLQLLRSPQHANDMIVVLADVHLDNPKVLQRIANMCEGLKSHAPPAFVFMGNFTSEPVSNQPGEMMKLKGYFDSLCDILLKFPSLCRDSHFIFIPGPRDLPAALGSCLPTPALPGFLTARLRERLAHVSCTSNPARVSWVNQELLFFRDDLLHRMRRACVRPPTDESMDVSQHLVRTIIDQSHLCPLPIDRRPIYWNHDHALRLYPLPDLVVLADVVDQYHWPYAGTHAANGGSFAQDGSFFIYYPARAQREREEEGEPIIEFSKC